MNIADAMTVLASVKQAWCDEPLTYKLDRREIMDLAEAIVAAVAPDDAARARDDLPVTAPVSAGRLPSVLREHIPMVMMCASEPHVVVDAIAIVRQAADVLETQAQEA